MRARLLRSYPTLLRIGIAEAVAYRAEFIVWMLTTTLPLVNMALWTAVAREGGPVAGYGGAGFVAYFLAALVIRQITGSWVLWELNTDIRTGQLSARLLRPIHPLLAYSAENLGALPLRLAVLAPVAVLGIALTPRGELELLRDPVLVPVLAAALVCAWLITFATMSLLGTLGFWLDSSLGVFDVWFAIYSIFSGYLVPLAVFPRWLGRAAAVLPFRYQLGYPVELATGRLGRYEAFVGLGLAIAWGAVLSLFAALAFRRGVRKFAAFGS